MHFTTRRFWEYYKVLPEAVQNIADQSYELLKTNPSHPSLHLKRVGKYWSVRISKEYRAVGIELVHTQSMTVSLGSNNISAKIDSYCGQNWSSAGCLSLSCYILRSFKSINLAISAFLLFL